MWKINLTDQICWVTFYYKNDQKTEASSSEISFSKTVLTSANSFPLFLTLDDTLLNGFTIFNAGNEFPPQVFRASLRHQMFAGRWAEASRLSETSLTLWLMNWKSIISAQMSARCTVCLWVKSTEWQRMALLSLSQKKRLSSKI